jgi:RNA polymerase sigma-70 factor (ECF subfamily)
MHRGARAAASADEENEGAAPLPSPEEAAAQRRLEALYREQSPRLLKSLSRRTSGRDEARDLVQEIFCRIARLGAEGPLRLERPQAYLSRMATNLLRDRSKSAARRMAASHVPADEATLAGHDQQRLLETRDMLMRVQQAMLKLRPKTREIFMAHRIDGLSYAEIAKRTGLSVKGVEKQMSKAIAKIDRMMDRD